MRLEEICQLKSEDILDGCFHVQEGKTDSASRVIPIHPLLENQFQKQTTTRKIILFMISILAVMTIRDPGTFKRQGRLRKEAELPKGVNFHSLRNTFATRMENAGVPRNHISQLMGQR